VDIDITASRRQFLGAATAIVAGGLAGAACSVLSSGPAASPLTPLTASPVARAATLSVASRGGPTPADWTALARDLSGALVRPGDASYDADKRLFDPRFDGLNPAGIAYCHSAHDVGTCLAFARKYGLPVAARSGGHSYAGWSSTTGLIVDVTPLDEVVVSGTTAAVGAGTRLIDVYDQTYAHGRVIPGGSCPTVGIAGLTLGGGIGVTGRAHGLTCDNLQQVEIVTADGSVRYASQKEESDLFWACQGGGGGNFGIVTRFVFGTFPASDISYFFLYWPWSRAASVVAGWQSWAPHAPAALWSNLHLSAAPRGSVPTLEVGGTYLGSASGLVRQLAALYHAVGSDPSSVYTNRASYLDVMLVMAGCAGETVAQCRLPTQGPQGRASRVPQYAKSDFFTEPLSSRGIATMLHGVEAIQSVAGATGGAGGIALDALGGAINRVQPDATAFVHRNALFDAQYTTNWAAGARAAGVNNQHAWLRSFWRSMRPYASGQAYQNYIDPDLTTGGAWKQAYYGANYTRLAAVKNKYDPERLFSFPQAVLPARNQPARSGPATVPPAARPRCRGHRRGASVRPTGADRRTRRSSASRHWPPRAGRRDG
jgi:FAD/FMN-containing dehydrogenase